MTNISLKGLTELQRNAIIMRYRYGWRMKRIALELGITVSGASRAVRRAQTTAGLPWRPWFGVIRTKPRHARAMSLSDAYVY